MKRLTFLFFLIAAILSLSACGNSTKNAEYAPPGDVEIIYIGKTSGDTLGAVFYNHGEQVIKDITVGYRNFNRNGFPLELPPYSQHEFNEWTISSINLVPGEYCFLEDLPEFYGTDDKCTYIEGIITNINYMDGTIYEASGTDSWGKEIVQSFSIDNMREKINNMRDYAKLAENNDYITITSISPDEASSNLLSLKINISVGDIGDLIIEDISFLVLLYDSNGYPVDGMGYIAMFSRNDFPVPVENVHVSANKSGTITTLSYGCANPLIVKSAKAIVSSITFANGDIWKNPYQTYWDLYYGDIIGK